MPENGRNSNKRWNENLNQHLNYCGKQNAVFEEKDSALQSS